VQEMLSGELNARHVGMKSAKDTVFRHPITQEEITADLVTNLQKLNYLSFEVDLKVEVIFYHFL